MNSSRKTGSSAVTLVLVFCLAAGAGSMVTFLSTGCGATGGLMGCAQRVIQIQAAIEGGTDADACNAINLAIDAIDAGCYDTLLPILSAFATNMGEDISGDTPTADEARAELVAAKTLLGCS